MSLSASNNARDLLAVLSSVWLRLIALKASICGGGWFCDDREPSEELLEANKNVEMTLSQQNQRNLIARATNVGAMTNWSGRSIERRVTINE